MNSSVGSGERASEGEGKGSGDAMISGWVMENQELGLEREKLVREFLEERGRVERLKADLGFRVYCSQLLPFKGNETSIRIRKQLT